MKNYLCLIFAICFGTHSIAQQNDVAKIKAVLTNQVSAWNEGNIPEYMRGYWKNDSLLFIGKNGITYGWEQTLKRYQKGYPTKESMGYLKFGDLKFMPLPEGFCFVTGSWYIERKEGNLEGWFSLLFRKIKGNWYIIADHSS
ncbi:MAG: DUF4440 domain-containing protein [Chitinophagaceae bacterium]|nr:DUF4440 domain-containing protein [Chitinophagaceae bacterium]